MTLEVEILKAIANAGHTFSPEATGVYVMRPVDARTVAETVVRYLYQKDALGLTAQPADDWAVSPEEKEWFK